MKFRLTATGPFEQASHWSLPTASARPLADSLLRDFEAALAARLRDAELGPSVTCFVLCLDFADLAARSPFIARVRRLCTCQPARRALLCVESIDGPTFAVATPQARRAMLHRVLLQAAQRVAAPARPPAGFEARRLQALLVDAATQWLPRQQTVEID